MFWLHLWLIIRHHMPGKRLFFFSHCTYDLWSKLDFQKRIFSEIHTKNKSQNGHISAKWLTFEKIKVKVIRSRGWFGNNCLFSDFRKPFLTAQEDDFKRDHKEALGSKSCVIYTGFPGKRKIFKIICFR